MSHKLPGLSRRHRVELLDATGKRPYPACASQEVGSLDELIEFPACCGVDSVVTHVCIDGDVFRLDRPVVLTGTLMPCVPRFPAGSIRRDRVAIA